MLQNKYSFSQEQAIELDKALHNDLSNYGVCDWKYANAIAAMAARKELNSGEVINNLNRSLGLLAKEEYATKFDENLNGLSATDFIKEMKEGLDSELKESKKASSEKKRVANHRYTIVPMQDHEACMAYAPYVCWCITYEDSHHYDGYTNKGLGKFYICLRDDFKKYPDHKRGTVEPGENAPLDDYGLSMIAVSVNPDGSCNTITTRWNHDNGGDDHAMTVEQLEGLLGVNFYETFKPRSAKELSELGYVVPEYINEELNNGANPVDLFESLDPISGSDGLYKVTLNGKLHNVYSKPANKIIGKMWFRQVDDSMTEGWIRVLNKDMLQNLMDKDGNLFLDEWVIYAVPPYKGAVIVKREEDDARLYGIDGTQLNDESFGDIFSFRNGVADVWKGDSMHNYIRPDGTLVSEKWFDIGKPFQKNGYALVTIFEDDGGDCYDLLGLDGSLLFGGKSKKRIQKATEVDGWYLLKGWSKEKGYNLFYPPSTLVSDEWFDGGRIVDSLGLTVDTMIMTRDGNEFEVTLNEDGSFEINEHKKRS